MKNINWKLMIPGLFFLLNAAISIYLTQSELTSFGRIHILFFPIYVIGAMLLIMGSTVFTKDKQKKPCRA